METSSGSVSDLSPAQGSVLAEPADLGLAERSSRDQDAQMILSGSPGRRTEER